MNIVLMSRAALMASSVLISGGAFAQEFTPTYSFYGTPGLIEMPTATGTADGEISATISAFGGEQRNTGTFQITPRLTGSFRYAKIDGFTGSGDETYDRSFDLQYRLIDEGRYRPAVAIGLRDFLGTGLYSSEYVVASKNVGNNVVVTGGLGWGRLSGEGGFTNPLGVLSSDLETRTRDIGLGGKPAFDEWFRGDAAFFGGVEWQVSDRLSVKAEYSSDDYTRITADGTGRQLVGSFEPESPFNFGATYRVNDTFHLSGYYLYGSELGLSGTIVLNPKNRASGSGQDPAPVPFNVRGANVDAAASWAAAQQNQPAIRDALATALAADGITLLGLEMTQTRVRVRFENRRYRSTAQAMGRVTRTLSFVVPASVETFVLEPVERGIPLSAITLNRSQLEIAETSVGGSQATFESAIISNSGSDTGLVTSSVTQPKFTWGVSPYFTFSTFDPDKPFLADLGAEFSASYAFRPNLVLSGAVRKRIVGNLDESRVVDGATGDLQPVRSNAALYRQEADPSIDYLTLAYYFRPADNFYGRVTAGYLESMFGGVSAELLWKPVGSRLALGAEINHVAQRDYDQLFGFQDYQVTMGHLSAYYSFGNGFHGQLDVGRYLAGDYGATIALDREFENGWRLGAYATFTDISADDFGEGSFDKGIRVTVPVDWFLGTPNKSTYSNTLRSLSRDGGSQLEVQGRLYETVRDGHRPDLEKRWGRFWR